MAKNERSLHCDLATPIYQLKISTEMNHYYSTSIECRTKQITSINWYSKYLRVFLLEIEIQINRFNRYLFAERSRKILAYLIYRRSPLSWISDSRLQFFPSSAINALRQVCGVENTHTLGSGVLRADRSLSICTTCCESKCDAYFSYSKCVFDI